MGLTSYFQGISHPDVASRIVAATATGLFAGSALSANLTIIPSLLSASTPQATKIQVAQPTAKAHSFFGTPLLAIAASAFGYAAYRAPVNSERRQALTIYGTLVGAIIPIGSLVGVPIYKQIEDFKRSAGTTVDSETVFKRLGYLNTVTSLFALIAFGGSLWDLALNI